MFTLCELLNKRDDQDDILKHLEKCFNERGYKFNQFVTYRGKEEVLDLYVLDDYFVLVAMIEKRGIK